MADVERAMLHSALTSNSIHDLVSRGISSGMFSGTPTGEISAQVFDYAVSYTRQYGRCPSSSTVQRQFPTWHGEFSPDPLPALADEFLETCLMRVFDGAVIELSKATKDRANWHRLDEIILDKAREVAAAVPSGTVVRFSEDFQRQIDLYEEEKGKYRPGTPLGIPVIDTVLDGIKPGWLVTSAGFSGIGKSFVSTHALRSAFEDDKTSLMLSLEMTAQETIERLHTMVMQWKHRDYTRRELSDIQVQNWRDVSRVYSKAKGEIIVVSKLGSCSLDRVHAEIERYKPDVVAIDYIQRMKSVYASRRPRYEQLEEITNELKTIAMDTDTAVIMVSQDGRSSAQEGSTSTNMGGSISVYQAADVYLGLMQDEAMRALSKMRVRLLKFRHGPLSEVDVHWDPSSGDFCRLWTETDNFEKPPVMA